MPPPRKGPRGLSPELIIQAALTQMEEDGSDKFSVRKVAVRAGCDPMSVLYHFQSKQLLERAMADAINSELRSTDSQSTWRERLIDIAQQYRRLALKYPHTFPLLLRFWVTGPADYRHAEEVYKALEDAGLSDRQIVDTLFGWYASILGLALAESGGLLKPATPDALAEMQGLDPSQHPTTHRLLDELMHQETGRSFMLMVTVILDGIARQAVIKNMAL